MGRGRQGVISTLRLEHAYVGVLVGPTARAAAHPRHLAVVVMLCTAHHRGHRQGAAAARRPCHQHHTGSEDRCGQTPRDVFEHLRQFWTVVDEVSTISCVNDVQVQVATGSAIARTGTVTPIRDLNQRWCRAVSRSQPSWRRHAHRDQRHSVRDPRRTGPRRHGRRLHRPRPAPEASGRHQAPDGGPDPRRDREAASAHSTCASVYKSGLDVSPPCEHPRHDARSGLLIRVWGRPIRLAGRGRSRTRRGGVSNIAYRPTIPDAGRTKLA